MYPVVTLRIPTVFKAEWEKAVALGTKKLTVGLSIMAVDTSRGITA